MFLFVLFCLFALVAVVALIASFFLAKKVGTTRPRLVTRSIAAGVMLLGLLMLFFSCATTVSTKNIGVLTTFGRPDGYLDNGFHLTLPWQNVTELNDAVQTDTYASDNGNDGVKQGGATDTCIHVRIERQATACVNVSVRWQIKPSGVDYLFRNYKDNAAIQDNLVLRDLQEQLNNAFVTYDPLAVDANGLNTNKPLTWYAQEVRQHLTASLGQWIDVSSVIVPIINYDSDTQTKVHQLLQQIALTRVAQQAEQTATAQAKANKALAASVSNDPGVLTDKCLNILKEGVDKGLALPAGFSCFANASTTVAIPAK